MDCPVVGCENEATMVLDLRVYIDNRQLPQTWICEEHYKAIIRKPKAWKFSRLWETGLMIEAKR